MGVSVENQDYVHRIDDLKLTGAKVKMLSLEPLLGPLPNLDLREIDWVIVGGESGPGARPMDPVSPPTMTQYLVQRVNVAGGSWRRSLFGCVPQRFFIRELFRK